MFTLVSIMSFVGIKNTAQAPAIPFVCHSFCLDACLGTSQKDLTHPSLGLTASTAAFLKGVKGQRGVWANGGTQRRTAGGEGWGGISGGRENVGQHS